MKILFLAPYPLKLSPSQRFRFEQYFEKIAAKGFSYRVQTFLNSHNWRFFFNKGKSVQKAVALLQGFLKRIAMLFMLHKYNFVFIHREVTPIGPPLFEWLITRVWQKKVIYDFDDAIWLTDRKDESFLLGILKWRSKVRLICRWSHKVSCGNRYLCEYSSQFNQSVVLNPTTVDTNNLHIPPDHNKSEQSMINIGWTGSHSTLKYLKQIEPILQQIEAEFGNTQTLIIADKRPDLALQRMIFLPWQLSSEASDLARIDIGIMPLPDDEWSKGKCGFKALQYMAMEIATIASPVGVNREIINHGNNGYLASTPIQWRELIHRLITDEQLRIQIGIQGRKTVIDRYSVNSNSDNFLSLFAL
jgi:glycosyltransferase involved in cell wall biosynthesis